MNLKQFYTGKAIGFVIVLVIVVGFFALWKSQPSPTPESAEFAQKIQKYVVDTIGQPIEGFNAALYMQAFPGLTEADFDGVETWEGKYVYADGKLTFTRPQTGRFSTAEEAITENGHRTLFDTLRKRLGNDLSVDEIISRIQKDASSAFVSVGDVLGAMTVVSVKPFNTGQYSPDPKMMQVGPQNAKIMLKGPIEITGTYSTQQPGMGGSSGPCISVSDATSVARLPVIPVNGVRPDVHAYSFCFRNGEAVEQQLGKESRTVTVTIDNFELNSYPAEVMSWADLVKTNLAAKLGSCKAFPNNSTQHVVETTRLFINTPKDIYPDKNINSDFETVNGNATGGYISNGGLPGEAYEATPECWSTQIEFDGTGEVDLKIKSVVKDVPDYFVRFVVGPTQ